jgi:hypothetical protein
MYYVVLTPYLHKSLLFFFAILNIRFIQKNYCKYVKMGKSSLNAYNNKVCSKQNRCYMHNFIIRRMVKVIKNTMTKSISIGSQGLTVYGVPYDAGSIL